MANLNITDEDSPLLFRERPDWADLTPLEQYENLTPIAPILYSEECKQRSLFPSSMLNDVLFLLRQGCDQLLSRNR